MLNVLKKWAIRAVLKMDVKKMNIYRLPHRVYVISFFSIKKVNIKFKGGLHKTYKLPLDK